MSPPWMPLYVADYLSDTRRLSTEQHGAYLLLIMEYWQNGGLPDDDMQLARIAGLSLKEWLTAKPIIARFFKHGWRHDRVEAELAKASEKQERRKEAGRRGGIAKSQAKQKPSNATRLLEQDRSNALASSSQPDSATHYPSQDEGFREVSRLGAAPVVVRLPGAGR